MFFVGESHIFFNPSTHEVHMCFQISIFCKLALSAAQFSSSSCKSSLLRCFLIPESKSILLPGEKRENSPPSVLAEIPSPPDEVVKAQELVFRRGICLGVSALSLPKLTPFWATFGDRKYEQLVDFVTFKGWCPEFWAVDPIGSWSTDWVEFGTDLVELESESKSWSVEDDGGVSLDVDVILQ